MRTDQITHRWMALVFGVFGLMFRTVAADISDTTVMLQEAQRQVVAFHTGAKRESNLLHLVYFHAADQEPLPQWQERLERVMTDVSAFYRDGMQRFGLKSEGLPMERSGGKLVFHVVRGKKPVNGYSHTSGGETAAEIQRALKGNLDFDRDHVLVFYALCRKEPDGRYVFTAPYYGGGSSRGGLAHAADCELLDPLQLTNKQQRIVYTEHYYPRKEQSVAEFDSMYLGGVAHELGHALGLPHDNGSQAERRAPGTSLMGGGNLNYREDKWGGRNPSYLSSATALRLISNPLITGSNRERWTNPGTRLKDFEALVDGPQLTLRGRVTGKVAAYGVVAALCTINPRTGTPYDDHDSLTIPGGVADGRFELSVNGLKGGVYRLRLSVLHLNGAATDFDRRLTVDGSKQPDAVALNADWLISSAEAAILANDPEARLLVNATAIARAPTAEAKSELQILHDILDPPNVIKLSAAKTNSVFLSDAVWRDAKVGWGQMARNHYWFDANIQSGAFLKLGGKVYAKGLYAHSPSRYVFDLDRKWKKFTALVGVRDGAQEQGSAVFTVRGDGKELYRSPVLRIGAQAQLDLDISGINELELLADGGEGHNHNSWAIWVNPQVIRD